jgi:hypothetical protein
MTSRAPVWDDVGGTGKAQASHENTEANMKSINTEAVFTISYSSLFYDGRRSIARGLA